MTKVFTPGVYPDNVTDCHAMLRLVEAMLGHEQARLAAVELLSQPTFKAADEITRLNAENEELRAALIDTQERSRARGALVDEMREGLEPFALAPIGSGKEPPEPFPSDDTQVAFIANVTFGDFRKLRALITKASRDSGHETQHS